MDLRWGIQVARFSGEQRSAPRSNHLHDIESAGPAHNKGFNGDGAVGSYLNNKQCPHNEGDRSAMTPYLIAARAGIICWVTLTLTPVEVVFDWLEDEIERRP